MKQPSAPSRSFDRAKSVASKLSGLSSLKLLLALAANSRPRIRSVAHFMLRVLAPTKQISYAYNIAGRKLIGFLRWKDIDSDLQSALELAVGDCYRLHQLPKPDYIIDGGANTGLFSLAASARWPQATIIAFEPVPSNLLTIQAHLAANHIESVKLEQAALDGDDGDRTFFIREANQGSFASNHTVSPTITVKCRSIVPFLPSEPEICKLIKLDIEGSEVQVLESLFGRLCPTKLIIVMELHNTPLTRPWIEELARRTSYALEFFEEGSLTAHCQLTSPDLLR